jgi:hypothetical protein
MLIERSQTSTFTEAIRTTFDGQHPCQLCKVIRAKQPARDKGTYQKKGQKLELPALGADSGPITHPAALSVLLPPDSQSTLRPVPPPTPPPRLG